jgi:hypothetical protein
MEPPALRRRLVDVAAERYRAAGRLAYHIADGRSSGDPVFGAPLAQGLVPGGARILDLGCRRGLLASWLAAVADTDADHIRMADLDAAGTTVMLDVLNYMGRASQEAVLGRVWAALSRAGVPLLRIGDASRSLSFRITSWVDRTVRIVWGLGRVRLHGRSLREWIGRPERLGFWTDAIPMSASSPFVDVLAVARLR